MTHRDYEPSITAILKVLTDSAEKLRVPTSVEELRNSRRTSRRILASAVVGVLALLFAYLSEALSGSWARPTFTYLTEASELTFAGIILLAVLPDMKRTWKEASNSVESQVDILLSTLGPESEVVAELLRFDARALNLTADRLDYEVTKVAARTSVLIDTKSITLVAIVVVAYCIFNLFWGPGGRVRLATALCAAIFVVTLYGSALLIKNALGVFEYRSKFLRMVANMKR